MHAKLYKFEFIIYVVCHKICIDSIFYLLKWYKSYSKHVFFLNKKKEEEKCVQKKFS